MNHNSIRTVASRARRQLRAIQRRTRLSSGTINTVAMLATALSALFSYLAVREMRRTNDLMAEQVHAGQLAYVMTNLGELEPLRVGEIPAARLTLKNYGQTPAMQLSVKALIATTPKALGTFRYVFAPNTSQTTNLGADQDMSARAVGTDALTSDTLGKIGRGETRLYVITAIQYDDVFGGVSLVESCAEYKPSIERLVPCTSHNTVTRLKQKPGQDE